MFRKSMPFCVLLSVHFSLASPLPQVIGLKAFHKSGRTFLTWREVGLPQVKEPVSVKKLRAMRKQFGEDLKVRFRVYRSTKPITALSGLRPIAEVEPFSAWNLDFYGIYPRPEDRAFRYVLADGGDPVPAGTGLYVYVAKRNERAYYAITYVKGEKENRTLSPANSLKEPLLESAGPGEPVLQRIEKPKSFNYVPNPTLYYYVRWEGPENCASPGMPFDYLVAVPPKKLTPAPVGIHLHCWGGNLNRGYGWWYNAEKGALLLSSNQIPYDWWTGYHERYFKGPRKEKIWRNGVVRPYTQRRLLSFLNWLAGKRPIDLTRTFTAGNSMGGSGSPMFAIRHPDRIAWAVSWVGVHVPQHSPQFKGSYARVWGEPGWNVKFEDGTPVWDYYNDVWYLRRYPKAEIGFITFSNGKNDRGIGWKQAVDFWRALQETHRPHVFVWGQGGHGQRARMPVTLGERVLPLDIRTNQSLPAFSNCSLDDDPGNGDPDSGDPEGQSNLYLFWETDSIIETASRWEVTLGLIEKAPKNFCTVDVTPRRLRSFKLSPGCEVSWRVTSVETGKTLASGTAQADRFGLVTIARVPVSKKRVRLAVRNISK